MRASSQDRRDLFRLAWPASLAMVVQSLYRLNDQYFVQDLGVEAQAAVAIGGMVAIGFVAFAQLIAVGTLAITARRLGEGDEHAAHVAIRTGLRCALAAGGTIAMVSVVVMPALCAYLLPGPGSVMERGLLQEYLLWIAAGQVVLVLPGTIDAIFFALKDTRTPMVLQTLAIVANAVLNSELIPRLGVGGAGAATLLSRALVVGLGLWLLQSRGAPNPWTGPASRAVARRILRIGLPSCVGILIYSAVYQIILNGTLADFDAAGRTALGVGFGIESIFWCFFWGVGNAVASLVGRALGEGAPHRARAIAHTAARVAFVLGLATSLVFWLLGPMLVGLFTEDPRAIASNVEYLGILAFVQPFQGMQVIYEQTLIGAGATVPAMVSGAVMNVLRIPLAHLLAVVVDLGLPGIWWAVNASSFGKWVWCRVLFSAGRWQHHKV